MTGGTGFYGKWLLESLAAANDMLSTSVRVTILTRDPAKFAAEVPHLAARPEFSWLTGDTADFAFPAGHFDYLLHFATASAAEVGAGGTATLMHTLRGTERVLQFAKANGVRRLLYASSGAVYGPQPPDLSHIPEDYRGAPDSTDPASAYGEMKRLSEFLCASSGVDCVIARGFSFVGPYLPLTDKFAVGSFIRDAVGGGPIRIRGDGTAVRSYLYGADLAVWLLAILVRGTTGRPYNVGSDLAVTLCELADALASAAGPGCAVEILGSPSAAPNRYVPNVDRARRELGLGDGIDLEQAIARILAYACGGGEAVAALREGGAA